MLEKPRSTRQWFKRFRQKDQKKIQRHKDTNRIVRWRSEVWERLSFVILTVEIKCGVLPVTSVLEIEVMYFVSHSIEKKIWILNRSGLNKSSQLFTLVQQFLNRKNKQTLIPLYHTFSTSTECIIWPSRVTFKSSQTNLLKILTNCEFVGKFLTLRSKDERLESYKVYPTPGTSDWNTPITTQDTTRVNHHIHHHRPTVTLIFPGTEATERHQTIGTPRDLIIGDRVRITNRLSHAGRSPTVAESLATVVKINRVFVILRTDSGLRTKRVVSNLQLLPREAWVIRMQSSRRRSHKLNQRRLKQGVIVQSRPSRPSRPSHPTSTIPKAINRRLRSVVQPTSLKGKFSS